MKWLLAAALSLSASAAFAQAPPTLFAVCGASDQMERAAEAQLAESSTPDIDRAAAQRAILLGKAQYAKALDGQAVDDTYTSASRYGVLAKTASDPEIAELYRRTARDQAHRNVFATATRRIGWATGLSDAALSYAFQVISREGCGVDRDNAAWLKRRIATVGWFKISTAGADADGAAFILVQHADSDPEFQIQTLSLLEPLVAAGETRPLNFAYLFDRVAVAHGRPQRYGTQGRCSATGWTPFNLEDPDDLDKRRTAVGLPPFRDYLAGISGRCRAASAPK